VITPWLDGNKVVFGKVLSGMNVVRAIENNPTGAADKPKIPAIIEDCGSLDLEESFSVIRAAVPWVV